jgi:acyl-CoA thioesterase-1
MNRLLPLALLTIVANAVAAAEPLRIVFLGDSITDGHIYPALVRQALEEAGQPAPVCINAGSGGDTAAGMRNRLDRDVLPHQPGLVALSAGINDAFRKVTPEDYAADITAIAERLRAEKIPLLIMTTSIIGPRLAAAEERLARFNAALYRIAKRFDCKFAEVNERMTEARKAGQALLDDDQIHPNLAGHRLMARAVLDALGHAKVPVPKELKVAPMPGLVRDWHLHPVGDKAAPATETSVASVKVDDTWKTHRLPEKEPVTGWWHDLERQRGFAMSLEKAIGPARKYLGVANLEEKQGRAVYFNTGAHLESIWLNGKRIYKNEGWTGWHAGKERIPAQLRAGRNVIVIETGGPFFLSCTDDNRW